MREPPKIGVVSHVQLCFLRNDSPRDPPHLESRAPDSARKGSCRFARSPSNRRRASPADPLAPTWFTMQPGESNMRCGSLSIITPRGCRGRQTASRSRGWGGGRWEVGGAPSSGKVGGLGAVEAVVESRMVHACTTTSHSPSCTSHPHKTKTQSDQTRDYAYKQLQSRASRWTFKQGGRTHRAEEGMTETGSPYHVLRCCCFMSAGPGGRQALLSHLGS